MNALEWLIWGIKNWPWLLEHRPEWLFGGLVALAIALTLVGLALAWLGKRFERKKLDPIEAHWQSPRESRKLRR